MKDDYKDIFYTNTATLSSCRVFFHELFQGYFLLFFQHYSLNNSGLLKVKKDKKTRKNSSKSINEKFPNSY